MRHMFSMIPLPIKIMAIISIIASASGFGYIKGSAQAEAELSKYRAKAEKQISDLKTENTKISDNVVTKFVDRTNTVREKEIIYNNGAGQLEPKYDLSNGWVHLHDTAAKLADPDAQLAGDNTPSGVMDNAALAVVLSNYARCHENKEQLVALQIWITDNKAAIEKANSEKAKK